MGHLFSGYITGKTKESAQASLIDWSNDNYDRQETDHGLDGVIWKSHICNNAEEAQAYLKQFVDDVYWESMGVGVAFKQAIKMPKPTKEYLKAKESLMKNQQKLQEIQRTVHYKTTQQKTVSCRYCGNRFVVANLYSNYCPICRQDMRPATVIEKENSIRMNIEYYYRRVQSFEQDMMAKAYKNADNVKTMYMVCGSIHC